MKKQSRRAQTRSSPPVRHQLEHVVPTVIHNPEEKMTALARWTHHAVKEPRRYLGWPAAIVAGVFLVVVVWKLAVGGRSPDAKFWTKLQSTKTAEERVELAKEYPNSPAATWALLQAATEYYTLALSDLPHNRDVALPTAKKALDFFDQVEREAPHDSPQARAAALGKARTLEMRNELSKALEQYQHVVKEWPESPEAEEAKRFVEVLKDPQATKFYKDLYAFSPTKMTLPPMGTESLPSSLLGPLSPGTNSGSTTSAPFGPLKPDANPSRTTPSPASTTGTGLPAGLLPPSPQDVRVESKTQTPTPKAPADSKDKSAKPPAKDKAEPTKPAASQKDLPADVFSAKPDTTKEKAPR
jgi:hypothetical protein